jgi:tetratricopeptide (TPR) repeat protein
MVLNNIACCRFAMGNHRQAFMTFTEARDIQTKTAQADLDLLHVAITLSNLGYLLIQLRQYDEAREMFEEALLVSRKIHRGPLVLLKFHSLIQPGGYADPAIGSGRRSSSNPRHSKQSVVYQCLSHLGISVLVESRIEVS